MASGRQETSYLSAGQLPATEPARRLGWRGRFSRQTESIRHRWQRDWNAQPLDQLRAADIWQRFRIGGLLALFLGLTALLVHQLWFRPVQTPMVAMAAPAYAWPFPPNAWTAEDVEAFKKLDAQESIRLADISPAWQTAESGLASLDRQLHTIVQQGAPSGSVILYVSMHGMADATGRSALLPPGASPLRSETWLKLSELLEHIKAQQLPDSWHKLLILDCNRIDVNWRLGILSDGFADGLADAVRESGIPNLAVLNSASPGERGWASADMAASVFGHYLRLGLAGAADAKLQDGSGGNGDHQVSLRELVNYLDRHVDGWAQHNRSARQRPMLVPASAPDFTVAWALNPRSQKALAESAKTDAVAASPLLAAANEKLWRAHDRLASLGPQRFDPLAWSDFEHKLLWSDEAIAAGAAYRTPVRTLQRQLQTYTDRIETQAGQTKNPSNILIRSDRFNDHAARRTTVITTHWIPLAEYLAEPDAGFADWRAKLTALQKSPSQTAVADFLAGLPAREHPGQFAEVQFLRLLQSQLPDKLWQQPALLSRALKIQADGDKAAVADDERGQFWSLPVVATGNHEQRAGRDQLFVGNDAALVNAGQHWTAAEDDYTKAEKLTRTVGQALAVRDRAWAEIPYFAAWLARPSPVGASSDAADEEINGTLLHLIRAAHALDATLASPPTTEAAAATESPPFEGEAREVRERLEHLEQLFAKECSRLTDAKNHDGRALRDLQAVLDVSWLPARQREQLRKRADEIANKLNRDTASADAEPAAVAYTAKPSEKPGKETAAKNNTTAAANGAGSSKATADREPDGSDYRHRALVVWEQHPALAILDSNAGKPLFATDEGSKQAAASTQKTSDKASKRAMVGDLETVCIDDEHRVRERLDAIAGEVRRLRDAGTGIAAGTSPAAMPSGTSSDVPPNIKLKDLIEDRAPHSRAEQLVRAAAGIGVPPLDDDPVRRLRQWDLQHLLLWHCRRALEDFWGPAQQSESPWFVAAAADSLKGVQAIGEAEPAVLAESNRLAKMLESRRQAAVAGLDTVASDVLLIDESEKVTIKMAVQPGPEEALHGLPIGEAVVFIRDAHGRIPGTSRSLQIPLTDVVKGRLPLDITLPGTALAGRGPMLEAVALMRGNRYSTNFLLRPTGGVKIEVEPYHYGLPQITLGGRSRRRASILFILDCSNSMSEPTDMEGPDGNQKIPRLDAAKIALKQMLGSLAEEEDVRVGLIVYGHRVGWNLKKPEEVLRQADYARPIPDDLRPSEDVELVLPLGRFDQVVAGGVFDLMKTLKPWGETPLYLSLVDAVGDFAHDEPGTEKTIVVITDGLNYQFNSPNPKTRENVITAMGDHKIPIEIVGFGISDTEAAAAAKEFTALGQETGGSYVPVSSGTGLVHSLESLLGPKGYEVVNASGAEIGHGEVGTSVTVRPKPAGLKTFTVSLPPLSTHVELAGGERAELTISADGRSIQSAGYQHGQPIFGPLIAGDRGPPTQWLLGVHRPIRTAAGASFPISVQRADHQFAPRMAEAWIEITPHADDPHTVLPTYIFYDANWEPGMPAPVLKLLAESWPAAAKQAEVRAWLRGERTPPDWVVKLGDVMNRIPTSGSGATLSGLSGVTYQVRAQRGENPGDPYRVAVIERFAEDSAGPGSLKVEIYPSPAKILHRFDPQNHLATDTFDVDETDDNVMATYELRFTRSETVKRNALQLAEPITRSVSDTGDLIRP